MKKKKVSDRLSHPGCVFMQFLLHN